MTKTIQSSTPPIFNYRPNGIQNMFSKKDITDFENKGYKIEWDGKQYNITKK